MDADLEMNRVTADAQRGHHWQTQLYAQAPGEVRHRFADVFLWQLFPDGL